MELQHSPSETRTYNDDNTLASISFSGAPVGDLGYTWDANKNKTSESIGGIMSGYGFSASYDAEDRLTSWDRADSNLDQSWELSPVGDWNSITENAAVQNRTHGPVHEILTAAGQVVQHDPKGNMRLIPSVLRPGSDPLKLTWDFDNKLRAADTDDDGIDDVFYRWDALGRRVGRDDGTNHTIYFQDGQQTLADYPAGAAAGSPAYTYVYGSYIDEVVLRNEGGGTRYYHRNQQYSIIALTDVTGAIVERYAYTAYGQVIFTNGSGTVQTASASNNRYTYTGREWDAGLSLYHFRARMHDAVAGRFISRDPVRYADGLNMYQYVGNRPLHYIDPHGNQGFPRPPSCPDDMCCCCPVSITHTVVQEIQQNRRYGVRLKVSANMRYQRKARGVPTRQGSEECSLVWQEWSDRPVWYGGPAVNQWLDANDFPVTAGSDVFSEWLNKPRPVNCNTPRAFHVDFNDEPVANNVDATYQQLSYIAIRVRGAFGCDCRPNDRYLFLELRWHGNGRAPTVTRTGAAFMRTSLAGLPAHSFYPY